MQTERNMKLSETESKFCPEPMSWADGPVHENSDHEL